MNRDGGVANGSDPQDHEGFGDQDGPIRDGLAVSEAHLAVSGSLRQRLIATLGIAVVEATQAGDLEAARIANEAVAKLLGTAGPEGIEAEVADLARKRREP